MKVLDWVALGWCLVAAATFVSLLRTAAPYGRHERDGWGPRIPALWAWVGMEAVSFVVLGVFAWRARGSLDASLALGALWLVHYAHRSFVYPLRMRRVGQTMPLSVALMAVLFNGVNATTNGLGLFVVHVRGGEWFTDPRFIVGVTLFVVGAGVNVWSDNLLLRLRRTAPAAYYQIPHGGLFRFVSCPNYFGEVLEWIGFAIAAWSLPALGFAVWTFANLVPRARAHHRWYQDRFADYPRERRAIFPFLY